MKENPVELEIDAATGLFGALGWSRPGSPRVLCLHGWLDNAASFVPLARHLESWDLVALDLAGHGRSQHRPRPCRYYFMDNLWDIDAALDALGWPDCHLLGHSMGGALACVFAAAAPERVLSLMLLDGLGPTSARPGDTVKRLRNSLQSVRQATGRLRKFPDVDSAARARMAVSDLSPEAARVLVERSLERHADHFRWRTDAGLNWHSPAWLCEEQVLDILAAIEAPVLSLRALPPARWISPEDARRRQQAVRRCQHHEIEGHHHFHMERPADVAPLLQGFMARREFEDVSTQD